MNRTGLFVSLALFLASGGLLTALGFYALTGRNEYRHGAAAERDLSYQNLPADSQSDWLTGFTLTERSGRELKWDDLAGQVRITNFFFTSCPATCLQQSQKVGEIQKAFAGQDVVFLSITCDPELDDPERLREYATKLGADQKQWLFLTGRLIYIRRVASELFRVALDKQTHVERLIVSDKWGNMRGQFHWSKLDEVTQLKLLVEKLLAETEPPADAAEQSAGHP
jgi:protein SCO1/2